MRPVDRNTRLLFLRGALRGVLLLLLCLGLTAPPSPAQVESAETSTDRPTSFFVDALSFAGQTPGQSRLDVFAQTGFDNLSFVKEGNLYSASYEVSVSLRDSSGALAGEKLWTEQIKDVKFDETVSSSLSKTSQRSFPLTPGTYTMNVQLRDLNSQKLIKLERKVLVRDFRSPAVALSDIMLISRVSQAGGKLNITPSISPNMGTVPDAFSLYLEMYNNTQKPESLRIAVKVFDEKKDPQISTDTFRVAQPGRNDLLLRVDHSRLIVGDYTVIVSAFPAAQGGGNPITASARIFLIRWLGMPVGVKSLDLAIEQLKYIAKEGELQEIKDAKTVEEKQKKFFDFWKKRDPNPNTPRNERMEEYYARVDYANKHFSHYMEGWRTDMGMVFIMFGNPSSVDRHPFEVDSKPYEVWAYFELNYQFVFVDETGFGDYRLATPLWEVWQRQRRQ